MPTPRHLAELIFSRRKDGEAQRPILLGCVTQPEPQIVALSLGQLQGVLLAIIHQLEGRGICSGQTIALVRLPNTSELPIAVLYLALSAMGVRVLFPMYLELDQVDHWLEISNAQALLLSTTETNGAARNDAALTSRLIDIARRGQVPVLSFAQDLGLTSLLLDPPSAADGTIISNLMDTRPAGDGECLLLTTSGTSGKAKLVRYTQQALLCSCAAWEDAGLFANDKLGGRGLSLLLGHSMGLRGLWNAIWTREPLCLITPEWFLEHPERVSSLLLRMQPEHVTGGPATFYTLLEFARIYPRLKEQCFRRLKCLVSSGTQYDTTLVRRVRTAFDLPLHNAFGMTEAMQVLSTLVPGSYQTPEGSLGNALPGVELRLDDDGLQEGQRLLVRSPFGSSGYLDHKSDKSREGDDWFSTGDLVEERGGALFYLGRENSDFINDGLGLRISRVRLQQLYGELTHDGHDGEMGGIAFFPLKRGPGLAALLFVPQADGSPLVTDRAVLTEMQSRIEHRLEFLRGELEELQFHPLSLGRFAMLGVAAPSTIKGNLSHREITRQWPEIVERLTERYSKQPGIMLLDRERYRRTPTIRLTSPRLGELQRLLQLDQRYERSDGDRLYFRDDTGQEREVLDFVGGYGGNLLGHRHPRLLEALTSFLQGDAVPLLDQGSARVQQGELARKLSLLVGGVVGGASFVVRFGSTGAEAVELALAHACLERQEAIRRLVRDQKRRFGHSHPLLVRAVITRLKALHESSKPCVLALEGAYHGHSLGARSMAFNAKMRTPFARMSNIEPIFIALDSDGDAIERIVGRAQLSLPVLVQRGDQVEETTLLFSRIIAAIAEPLLGEGGVREVPPALLRSLSGYDFPLILDEIQTGLGRTGQLLASEGIRGDYYLLSKALGGGLAKISAVLMARARYLPRFDDLYASTFAGDALSSTVAGRVLDLVVEEQIARRCAEQGAALQQALKAVQYDYPEVLREVRGRGLMIAAELDHRAASRSFVLRCLTERELLGGLAAGYLLHCHGVRVLPTLSAPQTLRVEPSAFIDDKAISRLAAGLREFCRLVQAGDAGSLLSFLVHKENLLPDGEEQGTGYTDMPITVDPPAPDARRVAFILHFVFPEHELGMIDPSLRGLSIAARRTLAERMMSLMQLKPTVTFARNLFGGKVWFTVLLLPADVATLETLHRMDYRYLETERLQQAVDLSASLGCRCVALGGYTSILAKDGTAILPPDGVQVTSGNTFTVVVGVRRLVEACARAGIDPRAPVTRIGVVGGTGNIGSSLIRRLLAGPWGFCRALIIGRNPERLAHLQAELSPLGLDINVSTDLADLRRCNVVAIATNTNEPLIYPEHLPQAGPVVISDVSVPSAVSRHVHALSHVNVIPLASTVTVPGAPDLVLSSHTPPGTAFCCAAEAMLIGLEPEATADLRLTGRVDPAAMDILDHLAERHGFFDALGEGGFKR